ncbi:MAG TPA: L-threonylcarbamoyladenylate synthase [Abditibacteriaceae bacterium]
MPIFPLSDPDSATVIERAAALLQRGELVAFPTETVYGLGANALDSAAVQKIFEAKGRPSYNPLIVHVLDSEAARALTRHWPEAATRLTEAFWPGPLSLVLPKADCVPDIVTAGRDSVALRAPAHPVARQLLSASGLALAAPSANRFTEVSPTTAAHVEKALGDRIAMILDGGACDVGIESTVLDLTGEVPVLLRPGTLSQAALETEIGPIQHAARYASEASRPSPGMIERHYAPNAEVFLFNRNSCDGFQTKLAGAQRPGALIFPPCPFDFTDIISMPETAEGYARELYRALHALDAAGCDLIFIEDVPTDIEWQGVRDRLRRSAHPA